MRREELHVEDEGRDQVRGDASQPTYIKMPDHQKLGERHEQILSVRLVEGIVLLTPQSQTSSLQNYETTRFLLLSPLQAVVLHYGGPYGMNKPPLGLKSTSDYISVLSLHDK